MRLRRLLVPLMFCYLLIAIWGSTLSSNCSLLFDPGPLRCAACKLYDVFDFWVREPLAVLVCLLPVRSSPREASPSTPCVPIAATIWLLPEPAVRVRGCELEKLALRLYVPAELGWFVLGRPPGELAIRSCSVAADWLLRCIISLCWTSASTPRPPCGGIRLLTTS